VAKRLSTVRKHAFFFSDWPQLPMTPWLPWARHARDAPDWLLDLDAKIRLKTFRRGGMPDVVAWNDDEHLASAIFVECKATEPVNENQEDWLWAARQLGVETAQFAMAVLRFSMPEDGS
jgi:hypothetical protein